MWRSFFKDKKWYLWSYGGGFFIISLLVLQKKPPRINFRDRLVPWPTSQARPLGPLSDPSGSNHPASCNRNAHGDAQNLYP